MFVLAGEVSDEWIDNVIEQSPTESVFALFETALNGDTKRIAEIIADLRRTEDPYRVFGLVNSGYPASCAGIWQRRRGKSGGRYRAKSSYPLQNLHRMLSVYHQGDL